MRSHARGQCAVKAFLGFVPCVQRPNSLTIPLSGEMKEKLCPQVDVEGLCPS